MSQTPYWYAVTTPNPEMPPDLAESCDEVAGKSGFLPRIYTALSYFPEQFRAFFAYHDALMSDDVPLSRAERELIVVATSATNNCTYCVVAHGALLRIRAKHPWISDQVAVDFEKADMSERQRAICRFAHKVAQHAENVTEQDFAPLYAEGLNDEAIWLVGSIAAFFALSNRLAGFAKILPNDEFYLMARQPTEYASPRFEPRPQQH